MDAAMRALLIAWSVPLVVAAAEPPKKSEPAKTAAAKAVCRSYGLTQAQDGVLDASRGGRARKLGDLPPARQQLALIRMLDGCQLPTVIRDNIGGQ